MSGASKPWRLWWQQGVVLARHEVWRTFRTRRALPILLLTLLAFAGYLLWLNMRLALATRSDARSDGQGLG